MGKTHPWAGIQHKASDLTYDLLLTSFKLKGRRSSFCKPNIFSIFHSISRSIIFNDIGNTPIWKYLLGMPSLRQTAEPEKQIIILSLPH